MHKKTCLAKDVLNTLNIEAYPVPDPINHSETLSDQFGSLNDKDFQISSGVKSEYTAFIRRVARNGFSGVEVSSELQVVSRAPGTNRLVSTDQEKVGNPGSLAASRILGWQ